MFSFLLDRKEAEDLSKEVNCAADMLTSYNNRLSTELDERKTVLKMLHDFIQGQQELFKQAEERMQVR